MDPGQKLVSTLVVPSRNRPKILEAIDPPFDDLAPCVGLCVKLRGASPPPALTQPGLARILTLGTDTPDLACPQGTPVLPRAIRPIHSNRQWPLPRPSRPGTAHSNRLQKRHQISAITRLAGRDQHAEWTTVAVRQDVDFRRSSPTAYSEPLVLNGPLFSS